MPGIETLLVGVVVVAALLFIVRHIYRSARGSKGGCGCSACGPSCGDDCPVSSGQDDSGNGAEGKKSKQGVDAGRKSCYKKN